MQNLFNHQNTALTMQALTQQTPRHLQQGLTGLVQSQGNVQPPLLLPGFAASGPPMPQPMPTFVNDSQARAHQVAQMQLQVSAAQQPAVAAVNGEPPAEGMTYISGRKIVNNVVTKIATPYSTGHIPCPYGCGRSFKHATQKAIHIRKAHTGERPFVCKVESCKKAFYSSGDLKSHEKTHSGLKPFECPTCGKSLSSRNALKVHTKALHTLDRPFKCDIPGCGMTYMTRLDLDRHMKKHNKWEQKEEKAKMLTLEKRAEKAEKKIRQMEQKLDKKEMSEAKCVNNGFTLQSAGKLVPCQPGDVVPEGVLAFFMPNSAGNNAKLDKLEVIIKRKARKPVVKSASKGQLGKALLVGTGNGVMGDGDGIDAIGNLVPGSANGTSTDGDDTAHGGSEAAAALAMTGGVGAEGRNDEDGAAPTARKGYKRKASSSTDPEATARASRKKLLENKMREEYEKQGFRGSIPFQSWRRGLSSEVVGEFQREVENDIANGAGGSGHGMNAAGDIVNGSDGLTK